MLPPAVACQPCHLGFVWDGFLFLYFTKSLHESRSCGLYFITTSSLRGCLCCGRRPALFLSQRRRTLVAPDRLALTSHSMKILEKLVLEQLRLMFQSLTEPLQFLYQPRLGVGDANIQPPESTPTWTSWRALWQSCSLTSAACSAPSVQLGWVTHWQRCGWMVCRCPELPVWQTTVCSLTTLCVRQRGSAAVGRHTVSLSQRLSGAWAGCISDTVGGNSVTWCDQSCAQRDVTGTKELIVDLRRTLRYLWVPDWSCCSQSLSCVSRIHPPCWNGQRAPVATQPVRIDGPKAGGEPQELPQRCSWSRRSLLRGSGPFSCEVWYLVWL